MSECYGEGEAVSCESHGTTRSAPVNGGEKTFIFPLNPSCCNTIAVSNMEFPSGMAGSVSFASSFKF